MSLTLVGAGFLLVSASGSLMFSTQAGELLANRVFTAKMLLLLLLLAACNAARFHARGSLQRLDGTARALTGSPP